MRVIVATHPATSSPASVGMTRDGVVYELFFTALPQVAFTAADVVDLYLQRGAFETVLSDEGSEQECDRWVSYSHWGQECWQIVSQWIWNLRLELGHHLNPTPVRMTELAAASPSVGANEQDHPLACAWTPSWEGLTCDQNADAVDRTDEELAFACQEQPSAPVVYGPPQFTQTQRAGKFAGTDFQLQADGTLRCPANHPLYAEARRKEHDDTVRVLYAARLPDCRSCLLRDQCLLHGKENKGPRRISAVIRPIEGPSPPPERTPELAPPTQPILWRDWSGRQTRRAFIRLLHTQTVTIRLTPGSCGQEDPPDPVPLTREQRAHWRLSWAQRLSHNARSPRSPRVHLQLFGIPTDFAHALGLPLAA